ncbi:MAG: BON domain-containing protein [Azonexus sp.]|jgi:osmotically-inducible protein OsmY
MTHSKLKLIAISLFLAAGLTACDKPGPAEKAGKAMDQTASDAKNKIGDSVDKAEKKMTEQSAKAGQAIDDTEITARVKAAVFAEPGLKTLQISVDTVKGVVTLTGTVDSQTNSDKARTLAAAVADVRDVSNKLVVTAAK